MQRGVDVRTGSIVIEDALVPLREKDVEAIGMAVARAAVTVVERDVDASAVTAENREPLRFEQRGAIGGFRSIRKLWSGEQQTAPSQIRPRKGRWLLVRLSIGGASPSASISARN